MKNPGAIDFCKLEKQIKKNSVIGELIEELKRLDLEKEGFRVFEILVKIYTEECEFDRDLNQNLSKNLITESNDEYMKWVIRLK